MPTNLEVEVRYDETLDNALKRFRRKIRKEGLMEQIRALYHYEKPSTQRHNAERSRKRRRQEGDERPRKTPKSIPRIGDYSDLLWEFEHPH
ncbi:MAG: hypothetical protein ACD_83C00146G0002 [uncultured bacterium]|nr:MAG: hypothetical protein ACD_83C00146G0002 [uncultured bacterium]